jgi:soluble lytic murein transglycosylase-like protein
VTEAILLAALSANISATLLHAVCRTESDMYNVVTAVDGPSASYGICQIKLSTARLFNPNLMPSELLDPHTNALYAALYLKKQLNRYKVTSHAVAAYNTGRVKFDKNNNLVNNKYVLKVRSYVPNYRSKRAWRD